MDKEDDKNQVLAATTAGTAGGQANLQKSVQDNQITDPSLAVNQDEDDLK